MKNITTRQFSVLADCGKIYQFMLDIYEKGWTNGVPTKIGKCCWKGFDHEESEGVWDNQCEQTNYLIQVAPHATTELGAVIADEQEEYACFAGMWWTPENKLAYMEPLCTIPEYRGRGLAAATLSEMYQKMKKLGATHMTGGMNEFNKKIGFKPTVQWTFWRKAQD